MLAPGAGERDCHKERPGLADDQSWRRCGRLRVQESSSGRFP